MTALRDQPAPARFADRAEAEAYVASVCFKHGPPRLFGVELEWTVHHQEDPGQRLDPRRLAAATGRARTTHSHPGQPPAAVAQRHPVDRRTRRPGRDLHPSLRLATGTLRNSRKGHPRTHRHAGGARPRARRPRCGPAPRAQRACCRCPDTRRWSTRSATSGPDGIAMMCSTAGLQVCLDFGEQKHLEARWAAVHALGPVLNALFANSPSIGGRHEKLGVGAHADAVRHGSRAHQAQRCVRRSGTGLCAQGARHAGHRRSWTGSKLDSAAPD